MSASKLKTNIRNKSFLLSPIVLGVIAAQSFAQAPMIESIIVTGQKIERSLQDTTTSVAVITELQMEERNISDFSDALTDTANAYSTAGGGFSIRGINGTNVSGSGNSFLASVYVDGTPLPRSMISRGGFSTWDATQVEILRGPQSTLQGRNALAGAVIMNTRTPEQEWSAKYRVQLGNEGQQEVGLAFGGGLIDDTLAFRFSGEKKELDGFNEYNNLNNDPSDAREDELYRLKLLLTPASIPDFSAQLSYTRATDTQGPLYIDNPVTGNPFDQRYVANNTKSSTFYEADLISLELNYQLNDAWNLTAVSAHSDVSSGYLWDADNGAVLDLIRTRSNPTETFSQELRLSFEYEQLTGLIGAYYYDQELGSYLTGQSLLGLAAVGLTAPFLQAQFGLDAGTAQLVVDQYAPFDPAVLNAISNYDQNISSYALFADFTYQINDKWDVYGGIRWDNEEQDNNNEQLIVVSNQDLRPEPEDYVGTPFAGIAPLIAGINGLLDSQVAAANQVSPIVDTSFDAVLPKIGLSYHWTDELMTSFTFQQGYRSGGVGFNTAKSSAFQYDPEYTDNFELSFRSTWLDGSLIANANLFYIDWTDQQIDVQLSPSTFDSETRNAGTSTIRGFELELSYQVSNALNLYGSIGQAKSEFQDFTIIVPTGGEPVTFDLAGRSFAKSPEWTSNVGATYSASNGLFFNVSANYAGDSTTYVNPYAFGDNETSADFDPLNDDRVLVNFQLGYEWENIGLYLIGKNIFDKEYIDSNNEDFLTLGQPRLLSLSLYGSF